MSGEPKVEEAETVSGGSPFCDAVCELTYSDDSTDTVRCTDRRGHLEAHSAKVWWSRDE